MRPGTAALPAPLLFPPRAGARAFLPAPNRSMFGRPICLIETGARSVVGLMRPGTAAFPAPLLFPPRAGARAFLPAPSRSKIGSQVCVIETGARSVVGLMRPGTAALPTPLLFPAPCGALGLHSCRALSSPPRHQYNPGIRIAGHGSTHQQLMVKNLNQDLTVPIHTKQTRKRPPVTLSVGSCPRAGQNKTQICRFPGTMFH